MAGDEHVNGTEIRVVGMSRSGNHAIIDWILAQARGRTCFLNCAEPGTNPFLTARPLGEAEPAHRANYSSFHLPSESGGAFSRKDLLIHSYEDAFLRRFGDARHEELHDGLVGSSARRVDVLIVRDPFNLFASRLASGIGTVSLQTAGRIWCQHAREFVGLRRHLGNQRVMVSYNAWVSSCEYRESLARRLGLDFDDAAARSVPSTGGGSSFDGTAYDGRAAAMPVLERWRSYRADPEYRSVFTPQLRHLAARIFGPLQGAETLASAA
jgi:hypothetical protein